MSSVHKAQDKKFCPVVYVLLPVHNRRNVTLAFVDCLKNQSYEKIRLILIDDGSVDGTAEAVCQNFCDVIVLRGRGNWWWAGSLQRGYEWLKINKIASDDIVLIMNDDTSFERDFIVNGLNLLKDRPATLITAQGYNIKTGKPQDSGGYIMDWTTLGFTETYDNSKINCASTRGLIMRAVDFLDVRGFYPRLLPHYLSDLEFTMRAKKRGKTLITHSNFRIGINFEETGYRELTNTSFLGYIKKIFSYRAAMNPVHWSLFILLQSDAKYIFSNLKRIWGAVINEAVRVRLLPEIRKFLKIKR